MQNKKRNLIIDKCAKQIKKYENLTVKKICKKDKKIRNKKLEKLTKLETMKSFKNQITVKKLPVRTKWTNFKFNNACKLYKILQKNRKF